jgi:virginiamycin B lyase
MPISLWHDLSLANPAGQATVIATGGDGSVWYFDADLEQLVRIDPTTHAQTAFDLAPGAWVVGLAVADDGTVWYSDQDTDTIGRLDPATGTSAAYPLTGIRRAPESLAVAEDGSVWFGDPLSPQLGHLDDTGALTLVTEPTFADVESVAMAPDGRVWYTREGADGVGAYDPATGAFVDSGLTAAVDSDIVITNVGDVWVSGHDWSSGLTDFARIDPAGVVTVFAVGAPGPVPIVPVDLAAGGPGAVAFLDQEYGFGTIDEAGAVRFSRLDGNRTALESDAAGHLWANDLRSASLVWY